MKHVIFIVNSIRQARCLRRIEEFVSRGYDVEVYGFDRDGDTRVLPNFPVRVIGSFSNGTSYITRLKKIRKTIKENITCDYDKSSTVIYIFNLDIVIAFLSVFKLNKYRYIYEVSDLAELTVSNKIIRAALVGVNKYSMRKAFHVVFTSEGFCDFYNRISQHKISVIPNRVSTNCPKVENIVRALNVERIRIGFVGIIRFETVLNFAKVCNTFENVEFHLFGLISDGDKYALELERMAKESHNITLHGPFQNPQDLPDIYKGIDMVLSAYPPTPSVIYAEPNKLYEAIYFRCPIIVNKGTFLCKKVGRLNVGYVIDAMDEKCIQNFLEGLDAKSYQEKINACQAIPQEYCLNINNDFFERLESLC